MRIVLPNPFPSKGFPIDEYNRLALNRVNSVSALSAQSAVKGLIGVATFSEYSQQLNVVCRDTVVLNSLFGQKGFENRFWNL